MTNHVFERLLNQPLGLNLYQCENCPAIQGWGECEKLLTDEGLQHNEDGI